MFNMFYVNIWYKYDKAVKFLRTFLIEPIAHVKIEGVGSA